MFVALLLFPSNVKGTDEDNIECTITPGNSLELCANMSITFCCNGTWLDEDGYSITKAKSQNQNFPYNLSNDSTQLSYRIGNNNLNLQCGWGNVSKWMNITIRGKFTAPSLYQMQMLSAVLGDGYLNIVLCTTCVYIMSFRIS